MKKHWDFLLGNPSRSLITEIYLGVSKEQYLQTPMEEIGDNIQKDTILGLKKGK
jgi:hypothetical protein